VHHDIWDYDTQSAPLLVDLRRGGELVPAVIIVNKTGLMFTFNRVTGKPIFEIEERPVPKSDVPGEQASPTQPFPVKPGPLAQNTISRDNLYKGEPQHQSYCEHLVDDNNMKLGGPYMPIAFNRYSISPPGPAGGINFWGPSYDPELHLFVSNTSNIFQPMRIIQREDGSYANSGPLAGTRRFGDPDRKLLCGPTPWGELVAVNMDTGDIAYRKTLGVSDALPPGMQDTGRPSSGGVVLTASGLTFVGGTDDFRFRAFATATGEKLWEIKLPSSVETTPITYLGADGRQFVAVVSTGGGLTGSQVTNDEIIAFAVPKKETAGDGPDPWFGTFSIIAFDPATNELGVGVQSRAFAAGAAVPYAKAGVGAVATQAAANRLYGPKAIALLEQGLSPEEAVKRITDEDPGRDTRQVAVIDTKGRSAVYTGKRVIDRNSDPKDLVHLGGYAGHVTGETFSVQGNTLASRAVVEATADAYRRSKGSMAERLMDALDAGQSKGGDTRGMQSAGLLVVKPIPPGSDSTVERFVDVRVDDSSEPFKELRRLMNMTLGVPQRLLTSAADLSKADKHVEAIAEAKRALDINPRNEQAMYALAKIYAAAGDTKAALAQLSMAISRQPRQWKSEAATDPAFEKLRSSPEFQQLIK